MTMDEMKELLARLDERVADLASDVGQIKHVLIEGNGNPAMTVRVALVEKELDRVKEERFDKKMPRAVWVGLIVTLFLGLTGFAISIGQAVS